MGGFFNEVAIMNYPTSVGTVSVSTQMTGKMQGVEAISTSPLLNPFCQASCKLKGAICKHCFAQRAIKMYKGLKASLERNFAILTVHLLNKNDAMCIRFNSVIGRIEAFGDVANVKHARNYIRIVRANKNVRFAVWTKNPGIWDKAIEIEGKPRNLSMVLSSRYENTIAKDYEKFSWVDYVFTVYTKEYLEEHSEITINCGAKKCMACQQCYRRHKDGVRFINELRK